MVDEVKKRTGWKTVDEIKMTGNYRGRECLALFQGKKYPFNIRFDSKGGIDLFSAPVSSKPSERDPSDRRSKLTRH